jgi:hypothetical protein
MWTEIQYVTTGLTLVAFIAAAGVALFSREKRSKADLIETAPLKERPALVEQVLRDEHIDVGSVPPRQRPAVIIEILRARARRYQTNAIVICFVATLTAVIAIYSIYRGNAATPARQAGNQQISGSANTPAVSTEAELAVNPLKIPSQLQTAEQPGEENIQSTSGLCALLTKGPPTEQPADTWGSTIRLSWVVPDSEIATHFQAPIPKCEGDRTVWGCKWTGTDRTVFEKTYSLLKREVTSCVGKELIHSEKTHANWSTAWLSQYMTVLELERPNETVEFELYPYLLSVRQNREPR